MYRVIANFKDRCDVVCGSFETRREAIECGLVERTRGALLVMIAGPLVSGTSSLDPARFTGEQGSNRETATWALLTAKQRLDQAYERIRSGDYT